MNQHNGHHKDRTKVKAVNERLKTVGQMLYGGDYNPDQWPEEIWEQDFAIFKEAHINVLTLPVFSWAKIEPEEGVYCLEWLDDIFDRAEAAGIQICLATSTAVQPNWLSHKYPDMLRVDVDGNRRKYGGRVNFCPSSPAYLARAKALVTVLANRYGKRANLLMWHIGNEYDNVCYCERCEAGFRDWAKARYKTLETLNDRWYMHFWGHTLTSFDEIVAPNTRTEVWFGPHERTTFQPIALDYKRYMSDVILGAYLNEKEVVNRLTPHVPVTTNLMGAFKPLNYFEWAKHMDIISWDNYPNPSDEPFAVAMRHDLMRSLKGGQPFLLMEQTPSTTNWQPYNATKRPGMLRLQSYQTLAHGGDSIMYFQMRQGRGACEKYHGALIDHSGRTDTRVFKECQQLGLELKALGAQMIGAETPARVGIIFDWENWWALELSSGPSVELHYINQIEKYYQACHKLNIGIDFIRPEWDLSVYDLVIAPALYMVKAGQEDRFKEYVAGGGKLLTTFFSGIVGENDDVRLGGFPGQMMDLFGLWAEETDALTTGQTKQVVAEGEEGHQWFKQEAYTASLICDVVHLQGAKALASFNEDYYAGHPALAVNAYGRGEAYYVASHMDDTFTLELMAQLTGSCGIYPLMQVPEGVEMTVRENESGRYIFLLNHSEELKSLQLPEEMIDLLSEKKVQYLELPPKEVAVLLQIG